MALLSAVLPPSQTPSENAFWRCENAPADTAAASGAITTRNHHQCPQQSTLLTFLTTSST